MKKLSVAVVCSILIATVAVFAQSLSVKQAENVISESLDSEGYNCDVKVGYLDENHVKDFIIEYLSGNEDQEKIVFLAAVTGGVAAIAPMLKWRADKVFVLIGEELYLATIKDCGVCYDVINEEDSSEEDAINCIESVWTEVEGD